MLELVYNALHPWRMVHIGPQRPYSGYKGSVLTSVEPTGSIRRPLKIRYTGSRGPSVGASSKKDQNELRLQLCRAVTEATTMTSLLSSRDLVAECRIRSMSSFICTTFQHEQGCKQARTVRSRGGLRMKTRPTRGIPLVYSWYTLGIPLVYPWHCCRRDRLLL